jgi:sugar-phosphatase
MPGAEDLVGVLTGRPGTPWAIVTSGNDVLARSSMRKVPVPVPPVVVTADDVRLGKPEPEPYLSAASALGVEPSACLVVEDAPAGVAAGRAAGMRVLGLATTYPREALARADWVVGSLADVRAEALGEPTGDARIRLTLR